MNRLCSRILNRWFCPEWDIRPLRNRFKRMFFPLAGKEPKGHLRRNTALFPLKNLPRARHASAIAQSCAGGGRAGKLPVFASRATIIFTFSVRASVYEEGVGNVVPDRSPETLGLGCFCVASATWRLLGERSCITDRMRKELYPARLLPLAAGWPGEAPGSCPGRGVGAKP